MELAVKFCKGFSSIAKRFLHYRHFFYAGIVAAVGGSCVIQTEIEDGTPEGTGDTQTPTPAQESTVTFTVDVTSRADGENLLAEVKSGEEVFLVGNLTGWNPNNPNFAMTETEAGFWDITLIFPLETTDYNGNALTVNIGDGIEYKFAKTTSDANDEWAEGEKDYQTNEEQTCLANTTGAPGGLWEVPNRTLTIASGSLILDTVVIDAWRDTAAAYGYAGCD